jgi:hypothetical protein
VTVTDRPPSLRGCAVAVPPWIVAMDATMARPSPEPSWDVRSSQDQTAYNACQHLLPAGTDDQYPPAELQLLLIGMLKFSSCMRSHGVPNFPDPATDSEGRPEFPLENVPGTSRSYWHSPRINHAISECQHLLPIALGGMPIG